MARFYTDNHLSYRMLAILEARGHDILRCQQLGRSKDPDHEHLWIATENDRIFLTSDGGFTLWHQAWVYWAEKWQARREHGGILIVPTTATMRLEVTAEHIDQFVSRHPSVIGSIHVLHDEGYWYIPPSG